MAAVQENELNPYYINWYTVNVYTTIYGQYLGFEIIDNYYDSQIIYFAIEKEGDFMKNAFIILTLLCMLLSGCTAKNTNDSTDSCTNSTITTDAQRFYTLDEFDWVEVGKTTRTEVAKYLGGGAFTLSSFYGWFCELPMSDGNKIIIRFTGQDEDYVVWSVSTNNQ